MEMIDLITGILKRHLNFMTSKGYAYQPVEIHRQDYPESIFAKLTLINQHLAKQIQFTIYTGTPTGMDVYIANLGTGKNIDLKLYADFKRDNFPRESPVFLLDKTNLTSSADAQLSYIQSLIEDDLKEIVFGEKWITLPGFDPRDDY